MRGPSTTTTGGWCEGMGGVGVGVGKLCDRSHTSMHSLYQKEGPLLYLASRAPLILTQWRQFLKFSMSG